MFRDLCREDGDWRVVEPLQSTGVNIAVVEDTRVGLLWGSQHEIDWLIVLGSLS